MFQIFNVYGVGKIINIGQVKQGSVGQAFVGFAVNGNVFKFFAVFFNQYNVGVVVGNAHFNIVFALIQGNDNVKGAAKFDMFGGNFGMLQKLLHFGNLFGGNVG